MTTLTVGSCFAGIGGLDLGLEATGGFVTSWHSEINGPALAVMAARFPDAQPLGDIEAIAYGLIPPPPVDLIAGGPPCQGISAANSYGRKGLADHRSRLFHAYADLIDQTRPRWVVMEQVPGLLTSGDPPGTDYRTVTDTFRELGYAIGPRIVNTRTYAPQNRARILIVGNRDPFAVARAVLPHPGPGESDPRPDEPTRRETPDPPTRRPPIYRKSRRPQTNTDAETWVEAEYTNTLTVSDVGTSRATVLVVDTNGRPRILTPDEWELAHGFPAGWTEPAGSDAHRWALLGNAVSPPVAEAVGLGILDAERPQ